jgi:hypothetical protein
VLSVLSMLLMLVLSAFAAGNGRQLQLWGLVF